MASYTERWWECPNYSGRGGVRPTKLTFHTTEGSTTGESLANWLGNPAAQVSYHAAVDMEAGVVHRFVDSDMKAWAQAQYNEEGLSVAFCTPAGAAAGWSRETWLSKGAMLDNAAAIGATFAGWYGIPLKELSSGSAQGGGVGCCQHANLGPGGGNHTDCGLGRFPMDELIRRMGGSPGTPPSQPPASGGGTAPPFPWPSSDYIGQESPDPHCHSGYYAADRPHIETWQGQMSARGWTIGVDGMYGPQSEDVCRSFQAEKGLTADGLVGPQTWGASWTAPVT
jgi:hypothetical protein